MAQSFVSPVKRALLPVQMHALVTAFKGCYIYIVLLFTTFKFQNMKNLLAMLGFLLIMTSCSKSIDNPAGVDDSSSRSVALSPAQVPAAVMDAFKAKYPNAGGEIEWQREDGNTYKVKFWLGAQRWQAIFSAAGGFISEKQIK